MVTLNFHPQPKGQTNANNGFMPPAIGSNKNKDRASKDDINLDLSKMDISVPTN